MENLELHSLHYWFKRGQFKNPPTKYNNVLNILQNSIYKSDISDTLDNSTFYCINSMQRSHANFRDKVILKNVFEHWKIYVVHKLYARKAVYKANYFYYRKMQKRVLNALSRNVLLKWKYIVSSIDNFGVNKFTVSTDSTKARSHYNKVLLKRYFNNWCKYVTIIHRKNEMLEKAILFYDSYCLKKCLINWRMYIENRRQKGIIQDKLNEACRFYNRIILQKCMKAWFSAYELQFQRMKLENAVAHYKYKLLKRYFFSWSLYHDYKIQKLNTKKYIEAYSNKKLIKSYFEKFVTYVNECIAYKIAVEEADGFYNSHLLQKAFNAWKEWYNKKIEKIRKINHANSIFEIRIKREILINWRLYIFRKKCERRKVLVAESFYKKKLLFTVLRKFYQYAVYRKHKKEKLFYLNDRTEAIIQQLQKLYISKWKTALYKAAQEKREINTAVQYWEINLIHKYFFRWKEYSRQYKIKSVNKKKLNDLAFGFFLKRFIQIWHRRLYDVLEIRKMEMFAVSTMQHKTMKKCMLCWKGYTIQKSKFKEDIEVAKELHKKFLLREGLKDILKKTLHNIDYRYNVELESAVIRSFKNMEILKEYFDKWHSLVYLKNKPNVLREGSKDNACTVTYSQYSYFNVIDDFKNTYLVLPEYMEKEKLLGRFSNQTRLENFQFFENEKGSQNYEQLA